jgi:hypothetical protein
MTHTTCTIGPDTNGNTCGAPAVVTFTASDGTIYAECAAHAYAPAAAAHIGVVHVGDRVMVDHVGVAKIGTVVQVAKVNVHVRVSTYGGKASKVIVRRMDDVRPA